MDREELEAIGSAVQEAVETVWEDHMEDLKSSIRDIIAEAVESAFEDRADDLADELADNLEGSIDNAVSDVISEYFAEGIEQFLANHQFMLQDGTIVQARRKPLVLSPDKTKLLTCYGGAKVHGNFLTIQTRISSWETLCAFETSGEAVEALKKVSAGIEEGKTLIEL